MSLLINNAHLTNLLTLMDTANVNKESMYQASNVHNVQYGVHNVMEMV